MKTILSFFALLTAAHAQLHLTETGPGTDTAGLQAPASVPSSITWILPASDGAADQCLSTDGLGKLGWRTSQGSSYALDASDGTPANALYVDGNGRVGIGTTSPAAGAALDLSGTGTGGSSMLIPRASTAARPSSPVNGMIRYNSTLKRIEGYQNNSWVNLTSTLMGRLIYEGASNCHWNNSAGANYSDLAADNDCPSPVASSGATAPGTKIPAIIINNLPPGDYEVNANIQFFVNGAGSCRWRFSDGASNSGLVAINNSVESNHLMTGHFSYASAGSRTFRIQAMEVGGTAGPCILANDEYGNYRLDIWVKRL